MDRPERRETPPRPDVPQHYDGVDLCLAAQTADIPFREETSVQGLRLTPLACDSALW
jgi:hypothetical protein